MGCPRPKKSGASASVNARRPLLGVAHLSPAGRGGRRGFEGGAGRRERIRLGCPVPSSAASTSSPKEELVRQQAPGEPGEVPDVLRTVGRRAAPDREVPEVAFPSGSNRMLDDRTFPCAMPWRCANPSAKETCSTMRRSPSRSSGSALSTMARRLRRAGTERRGRPTWLSPVVVDRNDVRMLQGRDGLGIRLEATDEGPDRRRCLHGRS